MDSASYTIRDGIVDDLPQVLELIRELAIYEREPDAVVTTVASMERDGFGPRPLFGMIVAEQAGQLVGAAIYYDRYSTWKGRCLYLEDLIVTASCRGQGIGQALFEATMQRAIDQDCQGMSWQVLDWNQPAIEFYQRYQAKLEGQWINGSLSRTQLMDCDR